MIIHVVREGDTLYKIGQLYNVDYKEIASDNVIPIDSTLVVGQTIVIITNSDSKKFKSIDVNGYAFTNIKGEILIGSLPHLTYLSIFSYSVEYDGSLIPIDDDELISMARKYEVEPVMVITNIGVEDRFNSALAHTILNDEYIQSKLIINVLSIMQEKGYVGLDIDFEYVYPEDKDAYINFINKVNRAIKKYNYFLSVALAPKNSDEQKGLLYEAHDYKRIGEIADHVILMTYEWGYSGGPARAISPIDLIEGVLDYATAKIPSSKILMGIPNYGYDWTLPYVKGELASSVGNYEAVDIARTYHQNINYNYEEQAPYFNYYDSAMMKHEVWFEDARSIEAKVNLVIKYNLEGISYWTIDRFFPQNYLVLSSLFVIK
ncbi:MAG: glycosyl hydrolase family 18 protein [Bacilli bacterium]|jgi:spore germination protein